MPPPQPLPPTPPGQPMADAKVYKIDPQVLDRPVKIRIEGSSRMLTKDILSQTVQFIMPILGNGPFLSALIKSGFTIDWPTMMKMIQDATGTQRQYPLMRPVTPQEMQAMQQPSPDKQLDLQKSQSQDQTRKEIMQMKVQGDQAKSQSDQRLKELEINERSAAAILQHIREEKQQLQDQQGDPSKIIDAQMKMKLGEQQLRQKAQEHQMDLQHKQVEQGMDRQHMFQQQNLEQRGMQMESQQMQQQHALKMHHENTAGMMKVRQILSTGKAKAAAIKMQPKKKEKSSGSKETA